MSGWFSETPVISCPMAWMVRPVGIASSASRLSTCDFVVLCTSTIGDAPVTVSDLLERADLQLRVHGHREVGRQLDLSRLTVAKPASVKVSE